MPSGIEEVATAGTSLGASALLGGIPVIGSLLSGLIQRKQNLKDIAAQNLYNHPKSQKERLREAGIPMAAMFSGGASVQSDLPRATNLDPSLGTAKGIESFQQNRLTQAQLSLLDQEIRVKAAEADMKEQDRDWYLSIDPMTGTTNKVDSLNIQKRTAQAKQFVAENQAVLGEMQNEIFTELKKQGVQVAKAKADLQLTGEKISTEQARRVVMSQQVQESVQRIAESLSRQKWIQQQIKESGQRIDQSKQSIMESKARVSHIGQQISKSRSEELLVNQSYMTRQLEEMINQQIMDDLQSGTIGGGFMAFIDAIVKKLTVSFSLPSRG